MTISKVKIGNIEHDLHASRLVSPVSIELSGDVSGSVDFHGGADVTIETVVADDSHNHSLIQLGLIPIDTNYIKGMWFAIDLPVE